MLKNRSSSAIVAVSDLDRARTFYEDTLGLTRVEGGEQDGVLGFRTGDTHLTVYQSDYAGTNKANAVVWDCGEDIEAIVADLRAKGVTFEHYPDMGATYRDGILDADGFKMVWFKDPDGNFLHLNNA